jgi:3-oxoacyl-[acyl-carrier protein] reductase
VQSIKSAGGGALAIRADSAEAGAVVAAVEQTVRELGGINILVNNAGIGIFGSIDDYKLEDLDRMLAVNVRAVFVAAQTAARHMKEGGRIIIIGSSQCRTHAVCGRRSLRHD